MIRKQDVLDRAAEWGLRPGVVEKDYVLGWLLAGIATSEVGLVWILKGGTCIKKCFFETYHFSEDLDFSLLPEAPYTEEEIRGVLLELTRTVEARSGIEFPADLVEVRPRRDRRGGRTFQVRISYRGPLAFPGPPRVLLDLTQGEPVLDAPQSRAVIHPYPDALPPEASVLTYSFDELLAEKTRALYERARPRDLYDVVYLLDNAPGVFEATRVRDLLLRKCETKRLTHGRVLRQQSDAGLSYGEGETASAQGIAWSSVPLRPLRPDVRLPVPLLPKVIQALPERLAATEAQDEGWVRMPGAQRLSRAHRVGGHSTPI